MGQKPAAEGHEPRGRTLQLNLFQGIVAFCQ